MFKNLRLVYVTTKDRSEALSIGTEIVNARLAACANIIDGMESVYHWKGKTVTDKECILILKTTFSNITNLTKRVKELHSYDMPCIISINLAEQEGNLAYLDWIRSEVNKLNMSDDSDSE